MVTPFATMRHNLLNNPLTHCDSGPKDARGGMTDR